MSIISRRTICRDGWEMENGERACWWREDGSVVGGGLKLQRELSSRVSALLIVAV